MSSGETWTFLRRRLGHPEARTFVERARRSPRLVIIHVDEATETDAWAWLHRHDERAYSFVDASSFAVMRRRRVSEALALVHRTAAGWFSGLSTQAPRVGVGRRFVRAGRNHSRETSA